MPSKIRAGLIARTDRFRLPRPSGDNHSRRGSRMFTMAMRFLIAALFAATIGFGGIESPFAGLARGLSLALFLGFGFCLVIPALLEARNFGARPRA
jgi:uncharacterized membrane protein YtjA (UPF0391 family)